MKIWGTCVLALDAAGQLPRDKHIACGVAVLGKGIYDAK